MLFTYGSLYCIFALYCSSVVARPGPFFPRAYLNTTSSASTTASGHVPITPITSSVTSLLPVSFSNSSGTTSWSSSSTSSPSSSPLTSSSSFSSSVDSVSTPTSSSTTTVQVSTTSLLTNTSTFASTTSPSNSTTATPTTGFNSTTSPHAQCHPKTTRDWVGSICISYCAVTTSFAFAPNATETVTQFVTFSGNSTALNLTTRVPQQTQTLPPQPCVTPSIFETTIPASETFTGTVIIQPPVPSSETTVSYITSKTTVTSFVPSRSVGFGVSSVQNKQSVTPSVLPPPTTEPAQSQVRPTTSEGRGLVQQPTPVLTPVPPQSQGRVHTQGLVESEVNQSPPHSQVVAPGTTIAQAPTNPGAPLTNAPTPTVVNGVTVSVGSSIAIIGSSTFTIGPGVAPITTIVNGQPVSIGPGGVGIGSTTLIPGSGPNPTPNPPITTQIATVGGVTLTEIGSTVIIGSQTFTLGPEASPTTVIVNGETFSLGPSGIGAPSTTLFIPPSPTTQVLTAAGVTFSEIGSSVVIIGSDTITLGAEATPTTTTIDGVAISIGPGGVGIGGSTTITPPSNAVPTTETITAGGITFSEIGSTIVVIGGTTFTIGPGATPTTDIFNSVTISLGPGGVGFASTTVPYDGSPTATSTASASGKLTLTSAADRSSRHGLLSGNGLFVLVVSFCMALWVAIG